MLYVREISPSASNYRANYPGRKRNLLEPANLSPPHLFDSRKTKESSYSIKTCSKNNQRKYNPSNRRRTKDRDTEFLSDPRVAKSRLISNRPPVLNPQVFRQTGRRACNSDAPDYPRDVSTLILAN